MEQTKMPEAGAPVRAERVGQLLLSYILGVFPVGVVTERLKMKRPGCTTLERFAAFGTNVLFVVIRARDMVVPGARVGKGFERQASLLNKE
jgi:hypothetical protein